MSNKKPKEPPMDPLTKQRFMEEYALRYGDLSAIEKTRYIDFTSDLFDKQRAFVNSPSKKKSAVCGRRSGKTICCAYYLIKTAYEQKCNVAYIALSRKSAKDIVWDVIKTILTRYKIPYNTDLNALQFKLKNGSRISLHGASSSREVEKHRGMYYSLVIVDECGSPQFYPLLEQMVKDVIGPTLFDTGGTLCLISTPGAVCSGLFYRITEGHVPGWDTHHWTVKDNSKFPRWRNKKGWRNIAELLLEEQRQENDYDYESPIYRREWLGQWVKDSVSLVYKFDPDNNTFNELPRDITNWNYIFGIDFGIVDSSAIVIGAYSPDNPTLYIVDVFKQNGLAPSDFADIINVYYKKYNPIVVDADANGMGAAFIAEIEKRFQLPIEPAEKDDKVGFIEILNDGFRRNNIKIKNTLLPLITELCTLQWKDIETKTLLDDGDDHCADAFLYCWRKSLHYRGKYRKAKPKLGSKEWQDQMFMDVVDKIKKQQDALWWNDEPEDF